MSTLSSTCLMCNAHCAFGKTSIYDAATDQNQTSKNMNYWVVEICKDSENMNEYEDENLYQACRKC